MKAIAVPCSIGDTLYTTFAFVGSYLRKKNAPYPVKCVFIGINDSPEYGGGFINVIYKDKRMMQFRFNDFGKTIFATKQPTMKEDFNACECCKKKIPRHKAFVVASSFGNQSFCLCEECLNKGLEPYGSVVDYIATIGKFPDAINETYVNKIRQMLPYWNIIEEKFIADVDAQIADMNEYIKEHISNGETM